MARGVIPEGCTWAGDPNERTPRHIVECPKCEEVWPLLAGWIRDRMRESGEWPAVEEGQA